MEIPAEADEGGHGVTMERYTDKKDREGLRERKGKEKPMKWGRWRNDRSLAKKRSGANLKTERQWIL